jgi:hypothetical protein
MPEIIHFNPALHRIEVEVYGHLDLKEWKEDLREIEELHIMHKCRYVLADIRKLETTPSLSEIIETVQSTLPKGLRYALVSSSDSQVEVQSRNFETASLQNDISVAIFNNVHDAEKWLML